MARQKTETRNQMADAPATRAECNALIEELGRLRRWHAQIERDMNEELARVKAEHEAKAQPLGEAIAEMERRIEAYCVQWRAALTEGNKTKTHRFPAGEVSWRALPAKVSLRNIERILEACRKKKLFQFIRTTEEINKQAMLDAPELAVGLPGVKIGSDGEKFEIAPFEAQLEEVA